MSETNVDMLKTIRSSLGGSDFSTETLKHYLTIKSQIITTKIQTLLQQLRSSVSSLSFSSTSASAEELPSLPIHSNHHSNMLIQIVDQQIDKISQEFSIPSGSDFNNIVLNRYPQILESLLSLANMLGTNEAEPITEVVKEALQPLYQKLYFFQKSLSSILDQQSASQYQQQLDQMQLLMALRQEQVTHEKSLSLKLDHIQGELQEYQQSIQQSTMNITASIVAQNRQFQQGFQSLINWESKSTEILISYGKLSEKDFQTHLISLTEKATVQARKPGISLISGSDKLVIANQLKPSFAVNAQNFHMHPVFTNINYLYYYLIQFYNYPYERDLANPSHWQSVANTVLKLIEKKWQQKNPLNEQDENVNLKQLLEIINSGKDLLRFMFQSQEILVVLSNDCQAFGQSLLQRYQEIHQDKLQSDQNNFLQNVQQELEAEIQILHNMPMPLFDNELYARLDKFKYMPPTKEVGSNIVYKKYGFLFRNLGGFSPESMEACTFDSSQFIKQKHEQARIIRNKCIEYLKGKIQKLSRRLPFSSHIIYPELSISDKFITPLFVPDKGFPIPEEFIELDKKRIGKVKYSYLVDQNVLTIQAFYQDIKGEEFKIATFTSLLEEFNELDNDTLFDYWYGGRYAKKDDTIVFYYQASTSTLEAEEGLSPHGTDLVYCESEAKNEAEQEHLEEYQTVSTHSVSLNKHLWDNYPPCDPYPENRNHYAMYATKSFPKADEIQSIVSYANQLSEQQKSERALEFAKTVIEEMFKDSKTSRLMEKFNCAHYALKSLGIFIFNEKIFTEQIFSVMRMHPLSKKQFLQALNTVNDKENTLNKMLSEMIGCFLKFMKECEHLPKPSCALIEKPLEKLKEEYEKYQKNLTVINFEDPNDEVAQLRLENQLLKEQISKHAPHHHASASISQILPQTSKKKHARSHSQ